MNYENNNNPGNMPGAIPDANQGIYDPNQMNQMDSMNQMNQPDPMSQMNPMASNLNGAPMGEAKPKKNMLPVIIAVVALVAVVGGLFTFKTIVSSPKAVFKNAIKNMYKGVSTTLDGVDQFAEKFEISDKALLISADAKLDSNIEDLEDLGFEIKNLQVGGKVGVDVDSREALMSAFVKGKSEEVTLESYYFDDKAYIGSNILEKLVYLEGEEVDIDYDEIKEVIEAVKESMPEIKDVDYLAEAVSKALSESLDTKNMDKENVKIKLNGSEKSFTKYSYKLTDKALKSILTSTLNKLAKDDKFVEILADVTEMEKSDIKEAIDSLKDEVDTIEYDTKIVLNLYTKGMMSSFAGISLEVENEEILSYVDDGDNFKLVLKEGDEEALVYAGERKGDKTTATLTVEGEDIAKLSYTITKEKIDFSFEITYEDETVGGSIYFTRKEEKKKISGEYKLEIKYNGEYLNVSGNYAIESQDKLDMPNAKNAITVDEVDLEKAKSKLESKMEDDEVLDSIFKTALDEMDDNNNPWDDDDDWDYDYDDDDDEDDSYLDSNDMKAIYGESDIKKALAETGVIYVGSSYYFSDEEDQSTLLENLVSVQKKLKFTAYRVSDYTYEDENIQELFKGVTPTCKAGASSDCEDFPIIFFVKDGKIVSALKGAPTTSDIEKEYQKIS